MDERHCEKCGYDLTGISSRGTCPECGSFYDVLTGKGLVGTSRTSQSVERGHRIMARIRTICLGLATLSILGCGGALWWVNRKLPDAERPFVIACVIGLVVAMATATSYLYEKD